MRRRGVQRDEDAGAVRLTGCRQLGIIVKFLVAISALILIVAGCGSQTASRKPNGPQAQAPGAEVASLLSGIPQRGNTLGNPKARVVVQYFGDLQCPFCKKFTLGTLRSLIGRYVRSGRLKIEYRSLKTATRDPETFRTQQVAALAAGQQNKMWNFIELFYHEQDEENSGYVTESYLQGLAQQVTGLNLVAWTIARSDPALANILASDAHTAREAGITSTPSFRLGRRRGTPYASAIKRLLQG